MSFRVARLGLAEWTLALGSCALLVDLFAASWFAYEPRFHEAALALGQPVSADGWNAFAVIGPLVLVVGLAGIAVGLLQATRRSPALPVVMTTLLAPFSLALVVALLVRVLVDPPSAHLAHAGGANVLSTRAGAYIGLALSAVIFAGVYGSLRRDGVLEVDAPAEIETLDLGELRGT